MTITGTITAFLDASDHWMTRHTDPQVVAIMGTDTIGTPWFAPTPGAVVVERLQALNPQASVVLE